MSRDVAIPPRLQLVAPSLARIGQYLDMVQVAIDAGEDGDGYALIDPKPPRRDPAAYVARLDEVERGVNLPTDFVAMSTRWLVDAEARVVGEARIRHALSPSLEIEGGHVGYFVHPRHRGRGYGRAILALALVELRARGVERVLVTCNADNLRSRRVIEANGGVFRRFTTSPRSGKQVATFWIGNAGQAPTPARP